MSRARSLASLPSVDRLLRHADAESLIRQSGRTVVTDAIRHVLAAARANLAAGRTTGEMSEGVLLNQVAVRIAVEARPSLRPVFNLTGTVLHTNLGRAPLPYEALEAMRVAALRPTNVEFHFDTGERGDRDDHLEAILFCLTGAEAATVVNKTIGDIRGFPS